MSARIAPTPAEDAEGRKHDLAPEPAVPPATDERAGGSTGAAKRPHPDRGGPRRQKEAESPQRRKADASAKPDSPHVPAPTETTWYTARDIDTYPRSPQPLRLMPPRGKGVAGEGATRLLLWVRIDENGEVVEVTAGEPGISAVWVDAARASLAAIRFTPARKDERAVRSRLLFSVSFAD